MKFKVLVFIFSLITGSFIGAYITNLYFGKNEPLIEYTESPLLDSSLKKDDTINDRIKNESIKYSEELYSDHDNLLKIVPFPHIVIYLMCDSPRPCRLYKSGIYSDN